MTILQLPKFTLESKVTLKQVLQNLKLNNAFGSNAEFGGITIREIHIDDIIHKGFISVNEEGTEAAATTFASFVPLSLWAQDFKADEPFLFALVKNSKTILFIGQYA
ncbi:unnamed protein product [Thelazia callipaeda]|uniref:SERPIN domain-containing protein n=1 Tax=Thelazia callipaeda TaxID=103827 RepID=A0A0N5CTH5_THECL|nr:unnamed protein product [Thelazia callipaeda]